MRRGWRRGAARMLAAGAMIALAAGPAGAEQRAPLAVAVAAPAEAATALEALIRHAAPRFGFRTRIPVKVAIAPEAGPGPATDLILSDPETARRLMSEGVAGAPRPVFSRDGLKISAQIGAAAGPEGGARAESFLSWLLSEVGRHALSTFKGADPAFVVDLAPLPAAPAPTLQVDLADAAAGETLAYRRCGRCHVVGPKNRMGGIGSTPSFGALKNIDDWRDRFAAFWTLRPHPSFTQIEGVTPPFDPRFPPPATPLALTVAEVEAIAAFVETVPVKDLGPPLVFE